MNEPNVSLVLSRLDYCNAMFGALKPGFRSLAALKLVANVVGEL